MDNNRIRYVLVLVTISVLIVTMSLVFRACGTDQAPTNTPAATRTATIDAPTVTDTVIIVTPTFTLTRSATATEAYTLTPTGVSITSTSVPASVTNTSTIAPSATWPYDRCLCHQDAACVCGDYGK